MTMKIQNRADGNIANEVRITYTMTLLHNTFVVEVDRHVYH